MRNDPAHKAERAFDVWLQRGLHQMYDSVAREPVPEALLRLIEGDRPGASGPVESHAESHAQSRTPKAAGARKEDRGT